MLVPKTILLSNSIQKYDLKLVNNAIDKKLNQSSISTFLLSRL